MAIDHLPRGSMTRVRRRMMLLLSCLMPTLAIAVSVEANDAVEVERYVTDYPVADRWCPPIRTAFSDAESSISRVPGKGLVRFQPNGGFGLPVVDKVDGQNLLHLGADLGWYRVGEPVFAVAAGVIRVSQGPDPLATKDSGRESEKKKKASPPQARGPSWSWGNLIVVEHCLRDAKGKLRYVSSVYGHLDSKRQVGEGDRVEAGQPLGTIGAKSPRINGGYNPHLHFAIRKGRAAEIGATLFHATVEGRREPVKLVGFDDDGKRVQVEMAGGLPAKLSLSLGSEKFLLESAEGKTFGPSRILKFVSWPDYPIVGYGLSVDDWYDPIAFLREMRADTNPAPLRW